MQKVSSCFGNHILTTGGGQQCKQIFSQFHQQCSLPETLVTVPQHHYWHDGSNLSSWGLVSLRVKLMRDVSHLWKPTQKQ